MTALIDVEVAGELIDGRAIARALKDEVVLEVEEAGRRGLACGLAVVRLGEEYSQAAYERRLSRLAAELGVPYRLHARPEECTQDELLALVETLNADEAVTGILILRPLPAHIDEPTVFETLSVLKDVEAVHPENAGLLALGDPRYVPSTAASTFHILDTWLRAQGHDLAQFYRQSTVVIVGRSANVGRPAASLAYARDAVVISVDEWASRLGRLQEFTSQADVLVVAAGVPGLIGAQHLKDGAIVLDVGINALRDPETADIFMVGDVDTASARSTARAVTPVPGGIGPVTDVWLLRNTVAAAVNLSSVTDQRLRALENVNDLETIHEQR